METAHYCCIMRLMSIILLKIFYFYLLTILRPLYFYANCKLKHGDKTDLSSTTGIYRNLQVDNWLWKHLFFRDIHYFCSPTTLWVLLKTENTVDALCTGAISNLRYPPTYDLTLLFFLWWLLLRCWLSFCRSYTTTISIPTVRSEHALILVCAPIYVQPQS